jgi:serine/threonine protein kinase
MPTGESSIKLEDPRVVAAVEKYRTLLQTKPDLLCDSVLEATLPDPVRSQQLRALLLEERRARRKAALNTNFESYFTRSWFEKCIDDLVAVMLDKEYLVEGRLGAGGQGRVYRVRNRAVHNRKEAMKIFLPTDPQYLKEFDNKHYLSMQARFDRESEALSRIHIDHLPAVHAVGNKDGLRYFTMEFIDGSSLARRLENDKMIDPRQAAQWILTVAETLEELHAEKILHRDLKPSNLILNEKNKLFIVDFGLVKLMPGADRPTGETSGAKNVNLTLSHGYGSRGYVSPEQASNASLVTSATDMYSLGATLFHLLNGFPYLSSGEDGPTHWLPHVPQALRTLCSQCLKINPEVRPTATEAVAQLRDWLQKNEPSTRVASKATEPIRPTRRNWLTWTIGGGVLTLGAGYFLFFRGKSYSREEITQGAKQFREKLLTEMRATLENKGNGVRTRFAENALYVHEAYSLGQTLASLLVAPELPVEQLSDYARRLQTPFNETAEENKIQFDRQLRPVGWVSRGRKLRYTFFDPVAWMTMAYALLIPLARRAMGFDPETLTKLDAQFRDLQRMFPPFHESRGGWFFYPNCTSPDSTSCWATSMAIRMLCTIRKADLPLEKSPLGNVDDLVKQAVKYLKSEENPAEKEARWVLKEDRSALNDRLLTLTVFGSLALAASEGIVSLEADGEQAATEFALKFSEKLPTELGHSIKHKAAARIGTGETYELEEPNTILWFPQLILLTQSLLTLFTARPDREAESRSLQQLMGNLLVKQGASIFDAIMAQGDVFVGAETLLALSVVQ